MDIYITIFSKMIFILLSCLIQNHLLRDDTAHSGMGSPTSTIIQENAPQICIQVILIEAFSHIILACVKLTN